ncbi:DUF1697 domain-containing protein [Streptomyces sp. NPDC014894]|uniref:DUF1697 domain-containing protein n=1 Tax=Streptomyces sp. NPDC014894 TaxID=3364931 RepID=UPI0036FCD121
MTTKTYAALLRGINVSGRNRVPMAELRTLLTGLGFGGVRTYLQSGNAFFTTAPEDERALADRVGRAVEEHFGLTVGVLVRDHAYLRAVVDDCPFPAASLEGRQLHVTYFSEPVDASRLASVDPAAYLPEEFRLGDRALYLHAPDGIGRSRLAGVLDRSAPGPGVVATTRNGNTAAKLAELTSR